MKRYKVFFSGRISLDAKDKYEAESLAQEQLNKVDGDVNYINIDEVEEFTEDE